MLKGLFMYLNASMAFMWGENKATTVNLDVRTQKCY